MVILTKHLSRRVNKGKIVTYAKDGGQERSKVQTLPSTETILNLLGFFGKKFLLLYKKISKQPPPPQKISGYTHDRCIVRLY